jgi:acylphosphatase
MLIAREYWIEGRVQGVGYRAFAKVQASQLAIRGHAMNLPDGRVHVKALGGAEQLAAFAARLAVGPTFASVRSVQQQDIAVFSSDGFSIA